jgi:hypothetical protein
MTIKLYPLPQRVLNTINKGNGNKVSSVGIIGFHVEAA